MQVTDRAVTLAIIAAIVVSFVVVMVVVSINPSLVNNMNALGYGVLLGGFFGALNTQTGRIVPAPAPTPAPAPVPQAHPENPS